MAADRTNCRGRQEASGSCAHVKPVRPASLAPRARATRGEQALELQPRVTPRRTLRTTGSAEVAPRPRGRCEACGTAPPAPKGEWRAGPSERTRTAHCRWKALRSWEAGWLDGHTVEEGPAVTVAVGRRTQPWAWVERQRSVPPAWHAVDNAAVGSERESAREGSGRSRVRVVKRAHALLDAKASQAASRRPGGAARRGRSGPSGTSAWPKGHRELGDPRLLTKESIAEVVSERLPVKRRGREVAGRSGWAGRSSLRDGRSGSHGRKGAEKA